MSVLLLASCSDARAGESSLTPVRDAPLAAYQGELLDLAFETVSAMPTIPHVKNRARAQEAVVAACYELEQPRRALAFVKQIDTWIRGSGYAEYAAYCARHGDADAAERHIALAREVYEKTEKENIQDWQRDQIRASIDETLRTLGGSDEADDFEERMQAVKASVATGGFDQVRGALTACAELFDRSYADPERRTRAEETIEASWEKLPVMARVEVKLELVESALAHADAKKTLELVDETHALIGTATWEPQDRLPLLARLAGFRRDAGDAEKARGELDAALAEFEAARERIRDFRRPEVLIPLAEAYQAMGDTAAARSLYARAVEEGSLNPNARVRAEDLSAVCCSMAVHGVEPDAELRARMQSIRKGLADPW